MAAVVLDNDTKYKIGEMNYGPCLGLAIVLRAMEVPRNTAQEMLSQGCDIDSAIAIKAIVKVIRIKKLENYFSDQPYRNDKLNTDLSEYVTVAMEDNISDYHRIQELLKQHSGRLENEEMHAVERMIKICLNNDLILQSKILSIPYTADHIRYICRRKVGAIDRANIDDVSSGDYELNGSEIDHIVEYQIIRRVCRDKCHYNITMAVGFALHFTKSYNLQIIDANENTKKSKEVTNYLDNGVCGELVEEIKTLYRDTIRDGVLQSIKESQNKCMQYTKFSVICNEYIKIGEKINAKIEKPKTKKEAELDDCERDYKKLGDNINAIKEKYSKTKKEVELDGFYSDYIRLGEKINAIDVKNSKTEYDAELDDCYNDYIRLGEKINANKTMYDDAIFELDNLMSWIY